MGHYECHPCHWSPFLITKSGTGNILSDTYVISLKMSVNCNTQSLKNVTGNILSDSSGISLEKRIPYNTQSDT